MMRQQGAARQRFTSPKGSCRRKSDRRLGVVLFGEQLLRALGTTSTGHRVGIFISEAIGNAICAWVMGRRRFVVASQRVTRKLKIRPSNLRGYGILAIGSEMTLPGE